MKSPAIALARALTRSRFASDPEGMRKGARMHCHAQSVHSVVIDDRPGRMIRVFFADDLHDLWCNSWAKFRDGMSVAFHPHHCALQLVGLVGTFVNWRVAHVDRRCGRGIPVTRYAYRSGVAAGGTAFTPLGPALLESVSYTEIAPGDVVEMEAEAVHTVAVEKGQRAAWLVIEGAENPRYFPECFSTSQLEKCDFSSLYQHCNSLGDLQYVLMCAGLLD